MNVTEVWSAVLSSDKTSIGRIDIHVEDLPRPIDGMFARLLIPGSSETELAAIYVHRELPRHWKEFVIIKEMMHCFTPMEGYSSTPEAAAQSLKTLVKRGGRYTINVAADEVGIIAAAEVILPHTTVEALIATGQDMDQIATRHGLHPEIVSEICRVDMMYARKRATVDGIY